MTSTKVRSLALALLAFSAASTSLPNRFTQDDVAIIERNERVQSLDDPSRFFTESYWPEPYDPALYRPLASLGYAVQWVGGSGAPIVFRIVSIALLILTVLALYRLLRTLVAEPAAWLGAALFAVHPVHVEAVAAAVNQSELVVALLAVLAVTGYLARRDQPGPWAGVRLFLLFLAALLFKESAAMILPIVLAAEVFLVTDSAPLKARLVRIRPTLLGLLLAAVVFMAVRSLALGGNTLGTFVAEALDGQSIGGRALIMLGVVPHWFRLLIWPEHLRADYSPMEIDPTAQWGGAQTIGLLLLVGTVALIVFSWRRAPVVAFGLTWAGLALAPVSNVLVPTGIVLAERTLFLPSLGFLIAVAGGIAAVWPAASKRPASKLALAATALVLIGLGLSRSLSRFRVWQTNDVYWRQAVIDAPRSYRAGHAYAQLLFAAGDRSGGEQAFRRAVSLYPKAWGIYFAHANRLRMAGMCSDAVVFYDRTLIVEPTTVAARSGMIACLLYEARYREASAAANEGARIAKTPGQARLFARFGAVADSAEAIAAPARTVQLTIRSTDTLP